MAKNAVIVKSNDFIEACYKLTLDEMRVLLLTIGEIDPRAESHRRDFEFTVAEFAERFDTDEKSAYKQVQMAIDKLGSRWVVVEQSQKVKRKVTLLTEQAYFYGEGRFQVILHEKLMPLVSNIREKFTKYNLEFIAKFNSFHAIRLYELLAQHRSKGFRVMTLEELKNWLQVADKYGERWDNFKTKVLVPAISEINEKSDLLISYEMIKRGRKIHALNFLIHHSQQPLQIEQKTAKTSASKTRRIHGVFDETPRPQVAKGSDAEGKWATENLNRVHQTLKAQGLIKSVCLTEKDFAKLPTEWLKVLKKYCAIADKYTAREIADELHKRK